MNKFKTFVKNHQDIVVLSATAAAVVFVQCVALNSVVKNTLSSLDVGTVNIDETGEHVQIIFKNGRTEVYNKKF